MLFSTRQMKVQQDSLWGGASHQDWTLWNILWKEKWSWNRQKYVRGETLCSIHLNKDRRLQLEIIVRTVVGGHLKPLSLNLYPSHTLLKEHQEANGDVMRIKYSHQTYRFSKIRMYSLTNQLWSQPFVHMIHLYLMQKHFIHLRQVVTRLCHLYH